MANPPYNHITSDKFNTELDKKLDKSTITSKVYGTGAYGGQEMKSYAYAAAGNTLAYRDGSGCLSVGTPTANNHAATKEYVDNNTNNKVDKTNTAKQVYTTDATGGQTTTSYSSDADNNSIVVRDSDGHASVADGVDSLHAVNKQQLDTKVDKIITTGKEAYIHDGSTQTTLGVSASPASNTIALYDNTIGNLSTNTPTSSLHCANKDYVDNTLGAKQDKLIASDNIIIESDGKTIKSNQVDDSLNSSTTKTYSIDKIKQQIEVAGATFRGEFATKADLDAYTGAKDKNDVAIVTKDETKDDSTTKYIYDGVNWDFAYVISTKPLVLDNVTVDYNASGELEVKNEGISLNKFSPHTSDTGKFYSINSTGGTFLDQIYNYKRVSTFSGVSGDAKTAYYLDTQCIVSGTTFDIGFYVWSVVNGFELIANVGTGGVYPIPVGLVQPGDSFPTVRPNGDPLVLGDYVVPDPTASFPFTIGTVTFENERDKAIYMGGTNWLLNASVYQKTDETPIKSKANESIYGSGSISTYQSDINAENKGAINAAVSNGTFTKTADGKIKLNLKDRVGNDVVNSEVVADVSIDNLTIDKNTSGEIQIKDEGINFNKMNPNAVGTDILADPVPTRLATNQAVYEYAKVDSVSIDRDPTIGINIKDEGVTFSKFHNDAISNHIPQTSPSSTKLTTESAVKNAVDKKQNKVVYSTTEPTGASEGDLWIKYEEVTPGVAGNFSYHRYDGGTWVNVSAGAAGDYLPLAGGTMTGTISLKAGDHSINTTVDNSYVRLAGGTTYEKGASLILKGKNSGMNPGSFVLTANSDGSGKQLIGQSSGALWWCGKEIQTAEALLDIFYPIGSYFFGDTPPSLGAWHEVEGDRAVWIKKGTADGTEIDQTLPKPSITCSSTNTGTHIHARGNQNIEGHFNFFWENYSTWGACIGESCSSNNPRFQVADHGGHRMRINAASNWTGEMAQAGDHNHAVSATVNTSGAYGTGEKVQPDALVMRVWKRLG